MFRSLQDVIRRLDVRRAQVLIEAVVAEVGDQAASEIGVQWQMPFKKNSDGSIRDSVIGGTNFTGTNPGNNIYNAAQNPLGVGNGFNLGYINGTITIGRNTIFQLGALVTALQGPVAKGLGNTDFSWAAGMLVAGGLYWVLAGSRVREAGGERFART